ncbi:MAG: hypothetical protein Q8N13_22530 [Acidovorax sp.]|nr:hypothetical protein [Acidovorax sp.]
MFWIVFEKSIDELHLQILRNRRVKSGKAKEPFFHPWSVVGQPIPMVNPPSCPTQNAIATEKLTVAFSKNNG